MNKKQKSLTNKGFSLVELIIVIAIMAVLIGVLAPQFIRYVEKSRQSGDVTSIQSITDYLMCAGSTLPDNIRLWARRNLAVAKSTEVTPEERRHAQRALSIMLNIQWKNTDFPVFPAEPSAPCFCPRRKARK